MNTREKKNNLPSTSSENNAIRPSEPDESIVVPDGAGDSVNVDIILDEDALLESEDPPP
jgi:hypothetical protein